MLASLIVLASLGQSVDEVVPTVALIRMLEADDYRSRAFGAVMLEHRCEAHWSTQLALAALRYSRRLQTRELARCILDRYATFPTDADIPSTWYLRRCLFRIGSRPDRLLDAWLATATEFDDDDGFDPNFRPSARCAARELIIRGVPKRLVLAWFWLARRDRNKWY